MNRLARRATLALSALALVASLGLSAVPAVAEQGDATIDQVITCDEEGTYQIELDVTEEPDEVEFSQSNQDTAAGLNLEAGYDDGCPQDGWRVTMISSNMVATGVGQIAASNVRLASLSEITVVSGQPSPIPTNPYTPNTPLNSAVTIMSAAENSGMGVYEEEIALELLLPGYSLPGTYVITLTASIVNGPN